MLIDWFTVIAQLVNFVVLVLLLKRFLYKPILDAIDAREKRIADEIAQAASKQADATRQKDEFHAKNVEFDRQRESLIADAVKEAAGERQKLVEQARKQFEDLRAQQNETLLRERENIGRQLVERTSEEVISIARKTLTDLASANLEECMLDAFVKRIKALSAGEKAQLMETFNASPRTVKVRSSFDLPEAGRAAIGSALNEVLSLMADLSFETASDLVCGIELVTKGFKTSWSIASYLGSLEDVVSETLKEEHAN